MQPGITDLTKQTTNLSTDSQPKSSDEPKHSKWKTALGYGLLIAIFGVVFWQRQNITDWWALKDYSPPVSVAQISTNTTMTDLGRKIFYLNKPQLQDKQKFYVSCEEGETAIVLGCYKPSDGIYLLDVQDDRLNGVEEVTASHEMLHAAYGRLSFREKDRIDGLLLKAYAKIEDQDVRDKIDQYRQSEADINNELHSILATEVATLPNDLELYYRRYFSERARVVNYSISYKSEFKSRKAKVDALDIKLKSIEAEIAANNQELKDMKVALDAESARIDTLLRKKKISEYNSAAVKYNQSLKPYRTLYSQTVKLVGEYKTILAKRNKLASEAQELNKALDSRIGVTVEDI